MKKKELIEKILEESIEEVRLAVKPFLIPGKMLENIKNAVRPILEKNL